MHDRLDLAIWLEPESSQSLEEEGIQAHLNFWKLPEYKALDIGIDLPFMKAGKVKIFIATEKNIDVANITYLLKDADILNIVFNEFVDTVTCPAKTKCLKAARRAQGADAPYTFCLRCLKKPVSVQDASEYGGKLIEIDVANACDSQCGCGRQYIRLRLTGDAITESYRKESLPFTKFEYCISQLECLDFRLNNVRSLPATLLTAVTTFPKLNKVRCFLMLPSSEDLVLYDKNYKKVRPLEQEKWDYYLSHPKKADAAILAYQWNSDTDEESFSLFAKINSSDLLKRAIVFFLLVTAFFGILHSLIASCIWDKLCSPV